MVWSEALCRHDSRDHASTVPQAVEHARGARLIDCVLARFMDHDGGSDPLHVCSQDGAPVVLVFAPVDLSRGGSCDVSWLFVLIPVSGNGCSL
ncbi:hypothetical protein ZWY2020_008547 [Hordeum vulgare]|nr:hypothetical protein ZWY2020_008547 [Hordeum vulgare]